MLLSHPFCFPAVCAGKLFLYKQPGYGCKGKHSTIPQTVGTRKDITVHLKLPDSFRIVRRVVVQGQCIREKAWY